jgi:hypothetical protein
MRVALDRLRDNLYEEIGRDYMFCFRNAEMIAFHRWWPYADPANPVNRFEMKIWDFMAGKED